VATGSDYVVNPSAQTVTVVGAGMAGAACAAELHRAGRPVRVIERDRAPGGRMASPLVHGRRVDLGAGYFTVRDDGFRAVAAEWHRRGLARPWTDTFALLEAGHPPTTKAGPMRWAAPGGLRALVRDVLGDLPVETGQLVDALPDGPVVLAMPDVQAARLTDVADAVENRPTIAVVCGWTERRWPFTDAGFVRDHPDVTFVVDDGARRGDGAPVLVAHTTPQRAARHLDRPDDAIEPVVAALRDLLGIGQPVWAETHRWTFAQPTGQHDASFGLSAVAGRAVGLAGDQWCPDGSPRVESAWRSGTDLAHALLERG
jgi:renalase